MKTLSASVYEFLGEPEFRWLSPKLRCSVTVNLYFTVGVIVGRLMAVVW